MQLVIHIELDDGSGHRSVPSDLYQWNVKGKRFSYKSVAHMIFT